MATVIGFGGRRRPGRDGVGFAPKASEKLGKILSLGVIPRLLIAHSKPAQPQDAVPSLIGTDDVESLAATAVHEAAHVLLDQVETVMRRGIATEEIFVDLLAPAARLIGRDWDDDRLDFVQVSMALWRLQEVLRQIAANATRLDEGNAPRSALFAPMPGDQHSFGTAMVHECFVIAGWDAEMLLEPTVQQLVGSIAERRYDLLGLTLSSDCNNERLVSVIRAVRSVSKNPNLCVMIGGRLPVEQPHLVALAGADGTAASAPAAIKTAERLVGMMRMAASA